MTSEQGIGLALGIVIPLAGFHWRTWRSNSRFSRKLDKLLHHWAVEHEILIDEYCERKGITRDDLPTRHNGAL